VIVFGAVCVGLTDLNALSILAALVVITVAMGTAGYATEVVHITELR